MDFQKVSFKNKELDLNLAGILYTPDDLDVSKSYPAVVVTGPMLSIKEQAQSVYAKRLAELGYVTLVFDGLVLLVKHVGERRSDACSDNALVVRVLVNIEKLDLIGISYGAVDVSQGDLPRGLCEREAARRAAGLDESRLRQRSRQLANVAGVGSHARRDGG